MNQCGPVVVAVHHVEPLIHAGIKFGRCRSLHLGRRSTLFVGYLGRASHHSTRKFQPYADAASIAPVP